MRAAAQCLTAKGYSGTRLFEIAEIAGVQAPGIYYYFASRDQLIEEVVALGQKTAREYVSRSLAEMPHDATSRDRLRTAVESHLLAVLELSEFTTAAVRNLGQLPADMQRRLRRKHVDYGRLWEQLFADAQKDGYISAGRHLLVARLLILGSVNWVPEWWTPKIAPAGVLVNEILALTDSIFAPVAPQPELNG